MFVSPGEIAFTIFGIPIHFYGLLIALALSVGVLFSDFVAKKYYSELPADVIFDISPYIIIGAIFGARLYYCLLNLDYFSSHLDEIIQIWQGGLSIHGGILGGVFAGGLYCKSHKLPILKICDIFSYGLILGQAIGRWGNFFNCEAFGRPTENFLKLYIPIYNRPLDFLQYKYFHPTFLYESVLNLIIFFVLYFIIRRISGRKSGLVFFSYLILYSCARILVEQLRIDSVLNVFGVPIAQIVSVLIILVSVISIFVIQLRNENK